MAETFHWIEGGAMGRLAAMLHHPETTGPHPAVLFCHGFTGTRVEPQRLFLSFARRLTQKGLAVLRFDFGGHGESEGLFRDLTLTGELQDANAAWNFLGRLPRVDPLRRGLLGFSLGGYISARCASQFSQEGLKVLALWAPVDDPQRLKIHFLGLHGEEKMLAGQGVDIGGLELGPAFARDLPNHENRTPGEGWNGPVWLARGEKDQTVPLAAVSFYDNVFKSRGVPIHTSSIPGAGHLFDRVGARELLYDATEKFLLKHLVAHGSRGV